MMRENRQSVGVRTAGIQNVKQLIAAIKTTLTPAFNNISFAELTLQQRDGTTLRPGLALDNMTGGRTDDYPLIIKVIKPYDEGLGRYFGLHRLRQFSNLKTDNHLWWI